MGRFTGLIGIACVLGAAFFFSTNRRAIRIKTVVWGLSLQVVFALFVLKTPAGLKVFSTAGDAARWLLEFSFAGSEFVFGRLGSKVTPMGLFIAFQVLPTIIFIAAFFAILYHIGLMQMIIRVAARVMTKLMGASGAESLNVAASIFMGQTEAPLTIRPFLSRMTRSELMTVMTSGMAHISGSIMVAYIAFGIEARHLLTAVIMTAPGTIMMAKLFEPETEVPETYGKVKLEMPKQDVNLLDAATRGTSEGLTLMLNVIAMLVSFVALVALVNGGFAAVHRWIGWFPGDLQ